MIVTKTTNIYNMNFTFHTYTGNILDVTTTLILGGGPHTDNKYYIDLFSSESPDKNFILIEYPFEITKYELNVMTVLLDSIFLLLEREEKNVKNIIGFSFGSYVGIQLANRYLPHLEKLALSGFLYQFDQLKKVFQKYQDKANKEGNTIDRETRDLVLMGVEDYKECSRLPLIDLKLQSYFEDHNYFESRDVYSERLNNRKYLFCNASNDNLTPLENIVEFIEEVKPEKYEIVTEEGPHSLSMFTYHIVNFLNN